MTIQALEIEIDGPHNERLYFQPLGRAIRGRFDFMRIGEPMARVKTMEWPVPIPSQRLGLDPGGNGYIYEPLHDDEYAPIKEKIEKMGLRLPPKLELFENVHVPTWIHWLKQVAGHPIVRVTQGDIGKAKVEGKPQTDFIVSREPSTEDKLSEALHQQTAAFNRLADALLKVVAE